MENGDGDDGDDDSYGMMIMMMMMMMMIRDTLMMIVMMMTWMTMRLARAVCCKLIEDIKRRLWPTSLQLHCVYGLHKCEVHNNSHQ